MILIIGIKSSIKFLKLQNFEKCHDVNKRMKMHHNFNTFFHLLEDSLPILPLSFKSSNFLAQD